MSLHFIHFHCIYFLSSLFHSVPSLVIGFCLFSLHVFPFLFYSILFCSFSLDFINFYSIYFLSFLFHSFYAFPCHSIPLHSISFHSILFPIFPFPFTFHTCLFYSSLSGNFPNFHVSIPTLLITFYTTSFHALPSTPRN